MKNDILYSKVLMGRKELQRSVHIIILIDGVSLVLLGLLIVGATGVTATATNITNIAVN